MELGCVRDRADHLFCRNLDPHDVSAAKAGEGPPRTSFMWKIVRECVRSGNDALLLGVLKSSSHLGYWVPSPDEFSDNAEKDMIAQLMVELKWPVAKILIDYCLERAHSTDPVLLEKLMISVPHLIPKHPDVALNIARRAAFLPVLNRDQVLQQAVYNGDQWRWGKFWVPVKSSCTRSLTRTQSFIVSTGWLFLTEQQDPGPQKPARIVASDGGDSEKECRHQD